MRLIDADALKTDLTRFYDNEVTAKRLIDEQPTVDAISVEWLIDRANDPERAPLYRRYAQMLYKEWREEQMFGDIDRKCPFSKCGRCTACKVLSINCDGQKYISCEQFRIVTSVKEQEQDNERKE